jgi:hypothetical protein
MRSLGKVFRSSSIASEGFEKQKIHQILRRAGFCSTHHVAYQKSAEVIMLIALLMRDWITSLERANKAASERRQRTRSRYRSVGP